MNSQYYALVNHPCFAFQIRERKRDMQHGEDLMQRVLIGLAVVGLCFSVDVNASEKPGQSGHNRPMKNVITVSPANALFKTPAEALDYLASVNPPPSADNRFLITIGPAPITARSRCWNGSISKDPGRVSPPSPPQAPLII